MRLKFFFDRCVSIRVARMIAAYETEHTIRHHDDDIRFTTTTSDVDWMKTLSEEEDKWTIVSGDGRILKNKVERAALAESKMRFFCLSKQWHTMSFHDQAWRFVKVWPDVVEAALHLKQNIFEVSAGKSLKVEPRN